MRKPVEIVWLDSGLASGASREWSPIEGLIERSNLSLVHSIGYLVAEDEQTYYLIQSYDPANDDGFNLLLIAKESVKAFNHLRRR